jgi:hypothetical protein
MRCREPGHRALVAMVTSRGPGLGVWVVRWKTIYAYEQHAKMLEVPDGNGNRLHHGSRTPQHAIAIHLG